MLFRTLDTEKKSTFAKCQVESIYIFLLVIALRGEHCPHPNWQGRRERHWGVLAHSCTGSGQGERVLPALPHSRALHSIACHGLWNHFFCWWSSMCFLEYLFHFLEKQFQTSPMILKPLKPISLFSYLVTSLRSHLRLSRIPELSCFGRPSVQSPGWAWRLLKLTSLLPVLPHEETFTHYLICCLLSSSQSVCCVFERWIYTYTQQQWGESVTFG